MNNRLKVKVENQLRSLNPALLERAEKTGQLETYLTQSASETAQLITEMEEKLLAQSPAPQKYLERLRHLEMIRREAEEIALDQLTSSLQQMPG